MKVLSFIWVGIKSYVLWQVSCLFAVGAVAIIISSPFIPVLLMEEFNSKLWLLLYVPEIIIWGHLLKND